LKRCHDDLLSGDAKSRLQKVRLYNTVKSLNTGVTIKDVLNYL
jgi:hypothetical protein